MTRRASVRLALGVVSFLAAASCGRGGSAPREQEDRRVRTIVVLRLNDAGDHVQGHIAAMKSALTARGYEEKRDYTVKHLSAQNELSNLAQIVASLKDERPDLLVTFQGPTLFAAIQRAPEIRKVFAILTDPFAIGAGRSRMDHVPNVTGVYVSLPAGRLFDVVLKCTPEPKRIGTLFMVGDAESVALKDLMSRRAAERGLELVAQPYTTTSEMMEALRALESKGVDALVPITDGYVDLVYTLMSKASRERRLPFFTFWPKEGGGASIVCLPTGEKFAEAGQFGELAARVFGGEDPTNIPFVDAAKEIPDFLVSDADAKRCGLTIPAVVRQNAKPGSGL